MMMKKTDPKSPRHSPNHIFKNIWFMMRYTFRYTPGYIWVTLTEALGRSIWHVLTSIVFVKYLFDALEKRTNFKEVLIVTLLVSAYRIVFELFNKWMLEVYRPQARLKLHEGMQTELYKKAQELDLSCYDNPEFYNDFIWAIRESDARTSRIMDDLSIFLNRIISTVIIISILATIDLFVAAGILISAILSFFIKIKTNKIAYKRSLEMNPINRKIDYIKRIFYLTDYAKELRQGEIGKLFKEKYSGTIEEKTGCIKKYASRLLGLSILSNLITSFFFDATVTGYLIIRYALDSTLTLGGFSASINATWKLFWQMNELTDYITRFNEHSIYADKFRTFIGYEPKIKNGSMTPLSFSSLEFDNVTFKYPFGKEEDKHVLKNVSLQIERGEKIAFVGYNGAGKTTITKLIMRLYDAESGKILYNGRDIKEYELSEYRGCIGTVFQDYKIFAATVAENVLCDEFEERTQERIYEALNSVVFKEKLHSLPDGILTQLTREFYKSGTGLSGGEAQKIALARVFVKDYNIIIMDEPSSALDPIAEYELNKSILERALDKTVIFISHRLSTTRMADRIYMFDGGEIVEQGSHNELMALGGKYAEMFSLQAKKYTG